MLCLAVDSLNGWQKLVIEFFVAVGTAYGTRFDNIVEAAAAFFTAVESAFSQGQCRVTEEGRENAGKIKGKIIEVKYKDITSDAVTGLKSLQFPVFVQIKTDKIEPDTIEALRSPNLNDPLK